MTDESNSRQRAEGNWTKVAASTDLNGREAMHVSVNCRDIAIFKVGEALYATQAFCTHALALLCDGYVEGEEVECPLHAARFHIPTGRVLSGPAVVDLETFPLKIVNDDVLIYVAHGERPAEQ